MATIIGHVAVFLMAKIIGNARYSITETHSKYPVVAKTRGMKCSNSGPCWGSCRFCEVRNSECRKTGWSQCDSWTASQSASKLKTHPSHRFISNRVVREKNIFWPNRTGQIFVWTEQKRYPTGLIWPLKIRKKMGISKKKKTFLRFGQFSNKTKHSDKRNAGHKCVKSGFVTLASKSTIIAKCGGNWNWNVSQSEVGK